MMFKKRKDGDFFGFILCGIILTSVLLTNAQIERATDITGGSSVFIFRTGSAKVKQQRAVVKSERRRTVAQKREIREKVVKQTTVVAKTNQQKRPTKRIDPETLARTSPQFKTMPPKSVALIFAGAGEYYLERNDLTQAIDFFTESLSLDAANRFGKLGLSDSFTRRGNEILEKSEKLEDKEIKRAQGYFEQAIKYDDQNATAYAGLGEVYEAIDQDKEALENYEKALKIDANLTELFTPAGILYYRKGDIATAEQYLTKSLKANSADAQTQHFLGLVRFKQNRLDDALAAFRQSLQQDANNAEAHLYIGEISGKKGDDKTAIEQYKKALEIDPKYVDAWFDLGVAQYNLENFAEAAAAYEKVTQLKNDYWIAFANLGDAYRQLNQAGKAEGVYRIAASRITDDAELYSKFGFVLGMQNKWKPAITQLDSALKIAENSNDYVNSGWAYHQLARFEYNRKGQEAERKQFLETARVRLQKAVELDAQNEVAFFNYGIVLNDLGDYNTAMQIFQKALTLRKDWLPAVNELGIAYLQLGKSDEAVKQFRKAVELNNKFAVGYYNLGDAWLQKRNIDEAQKALEKLKPLNINLAQKLELKIFLAKGAKRN